eukprot:2592519-Alexandrium_andersonii.AAC.1
MAAKAKAVCPRPCTQSGVAPTFWEPGWQNTASSRAGRSEPSTAWAAARTAVATLPGWVAGKRKHTAHLLNGKALPPKRGNAKACTLPRP